MSFLQHRDITIYSIQISRVHRVHSHCTRKNFHIPNYHLALGPSTQGTLAYRLAIHDYQTDIIARLMVDPLSNVDTLLIQKGLYIPI